MDKIFNGLKSEKYELVVVSDEKEAYEVSHCASYLGYEPFVLSDLRANYGEDLNSFSEEIKIIIKVLEQYYLYKKTNKILIAPIRTISYPLPKERCFSSIDIIFGETLNLESFKDTLYNWGYVFVDIVTTEGEVSIRGDIIDIFPLESENGYRISLFDDEIESIREFDVENQKSFPEELENISLNAAFLSLDEESYSIINERIESASSDAFIKDIHSLGFWFLEDLGDYYLNFLKTAITLDGLKEIDEAYIFTEKRLKKENFLKLPNFGDSGTYKIIAPSNLKEFIQLHKEKKITVISNTEAKLRGFDLPLINDGRYESYNVRYGDEIINLVSDDELIVSLNNEIKKRRKKKPKIIVDELKEGDYVVHETHGIGQFSGIEPVTVMGATMDFVIIEYQGDDKLLLPVQNLDLIDRYVADSGSIAVLDKLGKGSFAKLKGKVKEKLFAIASDIIALAAKRELSHGIKINCKKEEIALLQNDAGFEYTKDQVRSVNEIFSDLESGLVMDRLLSGDVGFGKTEVALNAMIATVLNGYQSLFICPTTLLSSQHYSGIKKRLEKYNIKVAKLDGRVSSKDQTLVKKSLADGTLDVVVGTHSLLNVQTNNLALVVIDEEHKFGVKQKEKIKNLRSDVHIFSMSATPIPRTLNLALSKIKGMSALLTPPSERIGVRSFVKEYDEKLIKELVLREKRRAGQIFYIYNNIATIEFKKDQILSILPNIKVEVMHSKITPKESERILSDFADGKFDILLATSIVESGLHLPNANTIVIDGANRFGIADLHQLRGRVGRSNKEGFCYFVVENKNALSKDAIKRLVALETNSYLGSGTALAHQDLEIRGGGNIVGEAQSGHIKNIGYSLYLRMLEDAIKTLSGEVHEEKQNVDIKLSISAYVSSEYIYEDRIRLEIYRRLSKANKKEEVFVIQDEMEDRFGKLDIYTKQFIDLILIKLKAIEKGIKVISNFEQNISFVRSDDTKELIKSPSKDDDDIIATVLKFLQ